MCFPALAPAPASTIASLFLEFMLGGSLADRRGEEEQGSLEEGTVWAFSRGEEICR
jgi:hypothetical protein